MTHINMHYDFHQTYTIYTLANLSSMYWPTLNCSRPLNDSTITRMITKLINSNDSMGPTYVVDGFEIVHLGNTDCRVRVDDVEGVANQSQGKILMPGEVWQPPFRLKNHLTFYTSSNTSQQVQVSVGTYA